MSKDWAGSQNSIFKTLGSSHHSAGDREENDFYATEPRACEWLLKIETFAKNVWEPACGMGHLSEVLTAHGHDVKSSDLIDRGYGETGLNFLGKHVTAWGGGYHYKPAIQVCK